MFDLDGTLSWNDTLLAYLGFALSRYPRRIARLWDAPALVVGFAWRRDRGALKSALIRRVLGGLSREDIDSLTSDFLESRWHALMRRDALAMLMRHQREGDYVVLMSASTDCYVEAIGRRLGVDEVICTNLRWQDNRLIGELSSPNRHGPEKTRCLATLRRRLPGHPITAYGNAASDIEHLVLADAGVVANGSAAARRAAATHGLRCVEWR